MRYFVLYACIALLPYFSYCQSILSGIPDSLKKDVNEIIISDETIYTITDVKTSSLSRKYKAIIMNSNASDRNNIVLYYSDFRTIANVYVKVSDQYGKEIETYKLKHFADYSTKGYSVASDSRAKYLKVTGKGYPYMVEVEYTTNYVGSLFYPTWHPQAYEKQSLINSTLQINSYLDKPVRYKAINVAAPDSLKMDNLSSYTWRVDSLPAFVQLPFATSLENYAPIVYTAPNEFEMDNYPGNMATWTDFGLWILQLNQNRNNLSQEDIQPVIELTKNLHSTEEKVRAVYDYLQNSTRYVSVQLGIGGWQPFDAAFVHKNKYGDCKALSFYTQSLLESIGIKSYYTLIRAGKNARDVDIDFPTASFNHAILTVPIDEDTVFLECTSQTNPFGYLGTFTSNRNALMITPQGGKIVRTRDYKRNENIQQTFANVHLHQNGSATVTLNRQLKGVEIENKGYSHYSLMPPSDQEKWFVDRHSWGNMSLKNLTLSLPSEEVVAQASMQVEVELYKGATASGKRLFYQPFIFTNASSLVLSAEKRTVPLEIKYPFTHVDTVQVVFPDFYHPEKGLEDIQVETKYGSYIRQSIKKEDSFLFVRKFTFERGTYPPAEYESFRNFLKAVQKYDREKLVMINKT